MSQDNSNQNKLKRTLGPLMLWGLGVGYVISGDYFGWNLGLAEGGTLGLAIATFFIIIMYVTFTFGYTELACAIPRAGGAFDYATRALGRKWGFLGGMAQNIEFIFAPPAIAAAIGAYFIEYIPKHTILNIAHWLSEISWITSFATFEELTKFIPKIIIIAIAIVAYGFFTLLNVIGVKAAAAVELVITILAVCELLIFSGFTLPHFEFSNLTHNAFPHGFIGVFAAIPFAIWFFLAIEGVANVAEETVNPQRNIILGFGSAILTLVALCLLTFTSAVGVAGWEAVVYPGEIGGMTSDAPLPLALSQVVEKSHFLYRLLITIGLFGLIASFHGIILAAGRATFEFGRFGYAPKPLGKVHSTFKTPANALFINMLIGILALLTGKTGEIIIIACFGALALYIISMISLFALRIKEPDLERPFKVPMYPIFPAVALVIASISIIAMTIIYYKLAPVFFGILAISYLGFYFFVEQPLEK